MRIWGWWGWDGATFDGLETQKKRRTRNEKMNAHLAPFATGASLNVEPTAGSQNALPSVFAPQSDTSIPNSFASAALEYIARSASSAELAYAT